MRIIGRFILLALFVVGGFEVLSNARAHDDWINRGGFKNPAGEWCCGDGDCARMLPKTVTLTSQGFKLDGVGVIETPNTTSYRYYQEVVPQHEALPSQDGTYRRCGRPDGTRRCFFAPPPSTWFWRFFGNRSA